MCHRLVFSKTMSPCLQIQPQYLCCEEGLDTQLWHYDVPQCVLGYLLSTKVKHCLISLLLESEQGTSKGILKVYK